MRSRRLAAAMAAAAVTAATVLTGLTGVAAAAPAAAVPSDGAANVALAGPVTPAAPDASTVSTVTFPLSITNTTDNTLYDVRVQALRSAPITSGSQLKDAFGGRVLTPSNATQTGPVQRLSAPIAAHASAVYQYVVDTSSTGICLCYLGVYALDLDVSAADTAGGRAARVGRTQTYLPSLTADHTAPLGIGWLWPLLDRPHRETDGTVFTDDELAASVSPGGRLDRALRAVEDVDAAGAAGSDAAGSDAGGSGTVPSGTAMLLVLDPETLAELVTMTHGYTVETAPGTAGPAAVPGTGGPAAARWLQRLAAVLPRHDVRFTAPADPDVAGLAGKGLAATPALDAPTAAAVAGALGLTPATLPPHDLGWPTSDRLDRAGLAAFEAAGATSVVVAGSTTDVGSVATIAPEGGNGTSTHPVGALVVDPDLQAVARTSVTNGQATATATQQLVAEAALSGVASPDEPRFVLVVPDRDLDVDPAAAARAVLATTSLGTPTSPLAALAAGRADAPARADLLATDAAPTTQTAAALTAGVDATGAAAAVRSAAVDGGVDALVGDLPGAIARAASNGWTLDPVTAARYTADLAARAAALAGAVRVVVTPRGSYSLASEDAPLLITVANDLSVPVRVRVDVAAVGGLSGFRAGSNSFVTIPAGSRPTLRIPTTVARAGRFEVLVTLHAGNGATLGTPARLTVNSSAVGAVGQIVTYGAGILLVLALAVRGVRRWRVRSRAGSAPTGDAAASGGDRSEDAPTVQATP